MQIPGTGLFMRSREISLLIVMVASMLTNAVLTRLFPAVMSPVVNVVFVLFAVMCACFVAIACVVRLFTLCNVTQVGEIGIYVVHHAGCPCAKPVVLTTLLALVKWDRAAPRTGAGAKLLSAGIVLAVRHAPPTCLDLVIDWLRSHAFARYFTVVSSCSSHPLAETPAANLEHFIGHAFHEEWIGSSDEDACHDFMRRHSLR